MRGYKQLTGTAEVPKEAGIEGFMVTIREILKLPRIQTIAINSQGKISYAYVVREDEEERPVVLDFEEVLPYAIIRNGAVQEIQSPHKNAAVACAQMFRMLAIDNLAPVAFVVGAASWLWRWYSETTGLERAGESLFGLPVLADRHIDDSSLLICGAYSKDSSMTDTVKSYRITIPKETK